MIFQLYVSFLSLGYLKASEFGNSDCEEVKITAQNVVLKRTPSGLRDIVLFSNTLILFQGTLKTSLNSHFHSPIVLHLIRFCPLNELLPTFEPTFSAP